MAAVQQVPTSDPSNAESPIKKDNFIESMEDEVRRCAEHLERRQSKKAFSTLDRKANGYSSTTSSSSTGGGFRSRKGNLSMRSTLPRSFNSSSMPSSSSSDAEDRVVLSPRIIPPPLPPARSPRLSPDKTFKFGGTDDFYSGHYKREEMNLSPSTFLRGNSVPPEAYGYSYGAGSGSCSRENSLTPLQSPLGLGGLGRTPIGAVASHSRQSSLSSSSPPPVPPKPTKCRSKREKSHTPPSPQRSQMLHKVEAGSFCKDSFKLDAVLMKDPLPPPLLVTATTTTDSTTTLMKDPLSMKDPLPPPLLVTATTTTDSAATTVSHHIIEFPSAEIDLRDSKVSILNDSVTTKFGRESSMDKEDYTELEKEEPAPPILPRKPEPASPILPGKAESASPTLPGKEGSAPPTLGSSSSSSSSIERSPSVDIADIRLSDISNSDLTNLSDPLNRGASDASINAHSVDLASSNEEEEEEEGGGTRGEAHSTKKEEAGVTREIDVGVTQEIEVEQEVDELSEELTENTDFLSPSDSKSGGSPTTSDGGDTAHNNIKTIRSLSIEDSDESLIAIRGTHPIGSSSDGGDLQMDKVEEVFILPSIKSPSEMMSAQVFEVTLPEVKSIPIHSHATRSSSKHGHKKGLSLSGDGHSKSRKRNDSEPHSLNKTTPSSPNRPCLLSEPLAGEGESISLVVKELQIKLREKEEDNARLQRQHERQLKDKDERIKKLHRESKKVEREKWELLKRARDSAERSLHLRTQLDMKEGSLLSTQGELERSRDELVSVKSANTSLRALLSDLKAKRSKRDIKVEDIGVQVDFPSTPGTDGSSLRRNRSIEMAFAQGEEKEPDNGFERTSDQRMSSSSLGLNWPDKWDRDSNMDTTSLHDDFRELGPSSQPLGSRESRKSKKKGAFFSKVIRSSGRRGSKTSVASMDGLNISQTSLVSGGGGGGGGRVPTHAGYFPSSTDLREQRRVLEDTRDVPFNKWDFKIIMAWMEAGIGMGQYSRVLADKFPIGQSLLSLTEADMEKKLGISNGLHRRKLMLALQEKKEPELVQYPLASHIDHNWVAFEWAHDCGLAHLTETLSHHLVDGRTLNSLTKEDLKKYFKMAKKTDQLSFLSGVELLRIHDFNREAIQEHRRTSNNPLYWTNRDMQDWLRQIDLQDYATSVIGGGVHGALLFFEIGRFTSDHFANIIQIPASKTQLRRHLGGKMASLFNEDIGSYMDHLPSSHSTPFTYSPINLSPSNKSGSQSPYHTPRSHSPMKPPPSTPSGHISPNCIHPSRRNSLGKNAQISVAPVSPPGLGLGLGFQRRGSTPITHRGGASLSPQHFQRSPLDKSEKARLSLRESALRSTREESRYVNNRSTTPTNQLRSTTPTNQLSSTTV